MSTKSLKFFISFLFILNFNHNLYAEELTPTELETPATEMVNHTKEQNSKAQKKVRRKRAKVRKKIKKTQRKAFRKVKRANKKARRTRSRARLAASQDQ